MNEKAKETLFYRIARPAVREIEAYDPGPMPADAAVRVSANENNRGVPQKAREALLRAIEQGNRYPDGRCETLRRMLAERHGVMAEQIVVGGGLDGVFTMLGRAFLEPGDQVVCAELTFSVYADTARVMGAQPVFVPLRQDWSAAPLDFAAAVTEKTKMVFFCNPNNPTGTLAGRDEIETMLAALPQTVLAVIDEAYLDFADDPIPTVVPLLEKYPNLVVCRTFSKIFGIAGLRVGYAIADRGLLEYLYKVRETYAVGVLSAAAAEGALRDTAYYDETRRMVKEERQKICACFDRLGIKYIPSQANFVTALIGEKAPQMRDALLEKGIVVRLLSFRGKQEMLRVSIGLPEENEIFMRAFEKIAQD